MDSSDYIAIAALAVSFLALFLSFTTKFTEFAKAPWYEISFFVLGATALVQGLIFLTLWVAGEDIYNELKIAAIVEPILGTALIIYAISRARKSTP